MFLENRSQIREVACHRVEVPFGDDNERRRTAVITTCETFRLTSGGLRRSEEPAPSWLRGMLEVPILWGVSVTLTGVIAPPERGKLAQRVSLEVGSTRRELVARPPRCWTWVAGSLVPGTPCPWQPLEMGWAEAFGGGQDIPAGASPGSGLPVPAHRASHPLNPGGKGFHLSSDIALGQPLPRLELLDDQLQRFGDWPFPGCFAPKPVGSNLHLPTREANRSIQPDDMRELPARATLSHHIAPSFLVLDRVLAGSAVRTSGMDRDVRFLVPRATTSVLAKGRARGEQAGTRLRALCIDADSSMLALVYHHVVVATSRGLPDLVLMPIGKGIA